ncbi:ankyrin repeat domain-containing protein [Riemerella columbipharyngis]|uniref:Ankyrin repeat-containing protein n=1 Tax=Riemerella columbipharyngis TaxID=1071918 RepID=A0A1G7BQF9_9FLAO|nr:ankyrin repeat domain-containing protein [Riemerella columbipharyngis]SDE28425.1 Ankyrin repeat-containing protein [Riemerella columbipharyngis]
MKKNYFDDRKLFITLNKNSIDEIISFLEPFGIDSYDRDGRTMLMNLIIERKEELLKSFMELNPNINSQDFNGYSALHFAVQEKFFTAIDLLLGKENLQIDLQDK